MTINKEIGSLKQDIDARLERLKSDIDDKLKLQHDETLALIEGNDLRYQQRFEAQGKALDAAFGAAKEAVGSALSAADKAAVKTEISADKRFADLGDLIREQFKGMTGKLEGLAARVTTTEDRLNQTSGEDAGERRTKDDTGRLWIIGIGVAGWITALLSFLFRVNR
jgi:hypothetical protein